MSELSRIVKHKGKRPSEEFDEKKLHNSIVAACLSVRTPSGEADTIASKVCQHVLQWCGAKPEVTSSDIRRIAADHLATFHPEAAYLYKHHRLVL